MLCTKYDNYKKEFGDSKKAIIIERDFDFITFETLKRLECDEETRHLVWKIWINRSHENNMDFKPNTTHFFNFHTIHRTTREDHSNINKLIIEDFIIYILNRVIYEKKVDTFYTVGNRKIREHNFDGIKNLPRNVDIYDGTNTLGTNLYGKSKRLYIVPIIVLANEAENYGITVDFYIDFI